MYNIQANGLSQAQLKSNNPKFNFLSFEPLMIKKSDLKSLKEGQLIELGKKLPMIYVYRKGVVVGQAELGRVDDRDAVIISAKERILNLGKPEPKHIIIEAKIAVLPKGSFTVGKLIYLPGNSVDNILLFVKGKLFAKTRLAEYNGLLYLHIKERY